MPALETIKWWSSVGLEADCFSDHFKLYYWGLYAQSTASSGFTWKCSTGKLCLRIKYTSENEITWWQWIPHVRLVCHWGLFTDHLKPFKLKCKFETTAKLIFCVCWPLFFLQQHFAFIPSSTVIVMTSFVFQCSWKELFSVTFLLFLSLLYKFRGT